MFGPTVFERLIFPKPVMKTLNQNFCCRGENCTIKLTTISAVVMPSQLPNL